MAVTTIFASTGATGRGWIAASGGDWQDVVDASTGTTNGSSSSSTIVVRAGLLEGRGGETFFVSRAFVYFDVSSITTTITAATVKVYSNGVNGGTIGMYQSTAFGNNGSSLTGTDFNNVTSTPTSATDYNELTWGTGQLRSFPLNATAITALNSNNYGNYSFRNTKDVDEEQPEEEGYVGINFFTSGNNRIQIEVTHADAGYSNIINEVSPAKIGSVNEVTTANISQINSVS